MEFEKKKKIKNKNLVVISTTINKELLDEIKKEKIKINYLISLGMIAHKKNPLIQNNILEQKKEIDILRIRLNRHTVLLSELLDFKRKTK